MTHSIKLQKLLADHGVASRRKAEAMISSGEVTVNGSPAHLGQRVSADDEIRVSGQLVGDKNHNNKIQVLLYHKPLDQICSRSDPKGRPTVFETLPQLPDGQRWVMVGRLDINTTGLLLFTNSGELAHKLMHPRFDHKRVYLARIYGKADKEVLDNLKAGVKIDGRLSRFESVSATQAGHGQNQWYKISIREGRNRIVRRLWESQGTKVNRLCRIQHGPIKLPKTLKPGEHTYLGEAQLGPLLKSLEDS